MATVTTRASNLIAVSGAILVFIVSVIVWSNCHILQFVHQMLNVSALLLDVPLLKCVVTEVLLFSIIAFKTLTFYEVVVAFFVCILRCHMIVKYSTKKQRQQQAKQCTITRQSL